MGEIIQFKPASRRRKNGSGKTLCKSGFHKWTDDPRKQFDVKQGKLVSVQRCARCAATRTLLR
jgi:hypothetical protein